ncbi:FAD-dependent oxidoreductase [Nesterenkonia massiliensis]|uniref:FAD-dependent oxidoreductase n=1 Tax=Nesterenkonia massiliensis TaxID=1232429 RepID=UPI0005C8E8AF|nr:NAD(P)/FAD-dependent oxidoreductase [Nesterenkonia massiliensis]
MPEVLVIGAGPVGLLVAGQLQRHGVDVVLLEQRPEPGSGSRAIGIHPPVLRTLEPGGLTDALLAKAQRVHSGQARAQGRLLGTVDFSALNARFPFIATAPQAATEAVLAAQAPQPQRRAAVQSIEVGAADVTVTLNERHMRAPLVILAGGARSRSLVYRQPEARHYHDRYLMTDTEGTAAEDPAVAVIHLDPRGVLESFPLPDGRRRFVTWDAAGDHAAAGARQRMRIALQGRTSAEPEEVHGFGVRRFVAEQMRHGRLFVIGDAAHEVSPIGGQGMNLGLLDAVTLAPLLARWSQTSVAPEQELRHWESQRLRSARRAAGLAGLNTRLGRPAGYWSDTVRRRAVRTMLGPGPRSIFTRAYAMGFDTAG